MSLRCGCCPRAIGVLSAAGRMPRRAAASSTCSHKVASAAFGMASSGIVSPSAGDVQDERWRSHSESAKSPGRFRDRCAHRQKQVAELPACGAGEVHGKARTGACRPWLARITEGCTLLPVPPKRRTPEETCRDVGQRYPQEGVPESARALLATAPAPRWSGDPATAPPSTSHPEGSVAKSPCKRSRHFRHAGARTCAWIHPSDLPPLPRRKITLPSPPWPRSPARPATATTRRPAPSLRQGAPAVAGAALAPARADERDRLGLPRPGRRADADPLHQPGQHDRAHRPDRPPAARADRRSTA